MSLRVEIDARICAGTSNCVEDAPDVFEVGDDGIAFLKKKDAELERLLLGASACPVQAIHIFDAVTGKRLFP